MENVMKYRQIQNSFAFAMQNCWELKVSTFLLLTGNFLELAVGKIRKIYKILFSCGKMEILMWKRNWEKLFKIFSNILFDVVW